MVRLPLPCMQASSALSVAASLDCSLTSRDVSVAVQRIAINAAMPCGLLTCLLAGPALF